MNLAYAFTDEYVKAWEVEDKKLMKIQDKIIDLEDLLNSIDLSDEEIIQINSDISELRAIESQIINTIDEIQQKSYDSFVVDAETKKNLLYAEKLINEKYMDINSDKYVGSNPVNFVIADFQDKQLFVLMSDSTTYSYNEKSSASHLTDIKNEIDVDVKMESGKFKDTSCRSRTSNCSPMVGGISVAKSGVGTSGDSTLSFKATDRSNRSGFVIAGHVGNVGDSIYQHASGNYAGNIITESDTCDCAFVESSRSMSNGIYKNYRQSYTINDYAVASDFTSGTFLKKSGITTGITYGNLIDHRTELPTIIRMTSSFGDSGAPVFKTSGNNAELFGIITRSSGSLTVMEPYPDIKSSLNLR